MKLDGPPTGGKMPVMPESILKPYRVWVNQEEPRQKKNPQWASFAPKEGAMLDLAADGKWRCLVTPAHVLGRIGEHSPVRDWTVSRSVRCSTDGFSTFLETTARSGYDETGAPLRNDPPASVHLNDVVGGKPRRTVVVITADAQLPVVRPSDD